MTIARIHLAVAAAALTATPAWAADRVAVIIGNNVGDADEARLRYAEEDAEKIHRVLRDLGSFRPEDMILLRGESTETVRRAVIRVNDRLRNEADQQGMLVVYYSGHADVQELHLGPSHFPIEEIEALVRGSPARTRILIVDACRSGALTRVKGAVVAPAFDIRVRRTDGSEGAVFLTSSSANEDAQESDGLRGSFFTHYLVSGLVGAADSDGDRRVTLSEAYAYAYEGTLRASSKSLVGLQHPTFSYELRGREEITLTNLATQPGRPMGQVRFPAGRRFLVMQDGPEGAVMAETGERPSRISLPPGRYFVRGRGSTDLVEGQVVVRADAESAVEEARLDRVAYARLVRKGSDVLERVRGVQAGYLLRTGLWRGADPCLGLFAAYEVVRRGFSLIGRFSACRSGYQNNAVTSTADDLNLQIEGAHVWDLRAVSLQIGLAAGPSLLLQRFETQGEAPAREALAGTLTPSAGAELPLGGRFALTAAIGANMHLFKQRDLGQSADWTTAVTFMTRLGLAARW
jgi:caspase domain-containing protein